MAHKKSNTELPPTEYGVIYARYSSHAQKEESIEQQIDECMAFAQANKIEIIHVYADKAVSGKTDKRTQFQRMMRDAEKREFSVVVAYKSNRMARNMLQALTYESKLDLLGIRTLYAKEEFGNTAAGRFALRTMMNVNQFYSENMAEDIKRWMADNATNCKVNGSLPLGYKKGEDGKYAIDEVGAAVVREVYDRVLAGESYVDIGNSLNDRGIKTKQGNKWNKGSFHRLLTNDAYIGVYRHSGVVVENGIPPILEREVFYAVQERLVTKPNPRGRHRENGDYLLTGKLYCGYCKSNMVGISGTGKSGKLHYYYNCNKRRTEGDCQKEHVQRDWIEQLVAELTKEFIMQDEVIEWIAENAVAFQAEALRTSELEGMQSELAENKKATKNIMAAIEQGVFTATTKDRLLELEFEISNLERVIALTKAMNQPVEKERIIWSLEQLRYGDVKSKEHQKRLIDTFIKAVYLRDDEIRIDYYYAGKNNSVTVNLQRKGGEKAGVEGFVLAPPASTIKLLLKPCPKKFETWFLYM